MPEPPERTALKDPTAVVRQLEVLWQAGQQPDPDALLAAAGLFAAGDVAVVLGADQWQRWHAGERTPAESYLVRHPAVAADCAASVELIYGEFLVREEKGEAPSPAEYLARFPQHADALRRQFEFHAAVAESGPTLVDASAASTASTAAVPGRLPPGPPGYELLEKVGEGGMGVVFKAWQMGLRRVVALKMLSGPSSSPEVLARFRVEAEAAARLQHANIVAVYEVGGEPGPAFLAMEHVEGGSLAARLAGAPLPPPEAARLLEALARAVAYAHSRQVIHRDLKPANVLLTADGTPKVSDFGLAKLLVGGEALTQTKVIMGTPAYMAPEQAAGDARAVGPAADIYALGAVLYECLTGRPPFKAATPLETLSQVMRDEPAPPRQLNLQVPRDLETVCLKCLHKEAGERYRGAADLADDLRRFLDDEPVRARPISLAGRLRRWARRNPALAALSAAALVLLVLVALVSAVAYVQTRGALEREAEALADARRQHEAAVRQRDQANRNLHDALVGQARALRLARVEGYRRRAWELLGQAQRLGTPERNSTELRLDAVACLGDFVGRDPVIRQDLPAGAQSFALRPDGGQLAVVLADGSVLLRDLTRSADVARLPDAGPAATCLTFAPRGQSFLAGYKDGTVKLWQPAAGQKGWASKTLARLAAPVYTLRWTPQGQRLACSLFSESAILRDLDAGESVSLPAAGRTLDGQAAFSPKGDLLAVACHGGTGEGIVLWEVDTRKLRGQVASGLGSLFALAFSSEGSRLACACTQGVVVLETASLRTFWFARCDEPFGVALTPDGRSVAYCASQDGTVRLASLISNRERAVLKLPEPARFLTFDAAGRLLLTAGGRTLRGWALQSEERHILAGHNAGVEGMAFSPDGSLLVSPSIDQTVKVWDPATGALLRTLGGFTATTRVAAFSPDGRLLAVGSADPKALVCFWDTATWEERILLAGQLDWVDKSHAQQVWTIAFSPDGERMAVGGDGVGLTLWRSPPRGRDAPKSTIRRPYRQVARLSDRSVTAAQFSPDGKHLAWVDREAVLHLHDVAAGQPRPSPPAPLAWHVRSLAFSPDSRSLLYLDRANRDLKRWQLAGGAPATVVPNARFQRSRSLLSNGLLDLSADGAWVALSGRSVTVWDAARGELLLALPEEQTAVYCIVWAPDRRRLAVGTSDGTMSIWNVPAVRARLAEIGLDWLPR
jgi:WD40 repeat protein